MTAAEPSVGSASTADVVAGLRSAGVHDVDTTDLARTLYSSDASIYRVPPRVVVRPQHTDELAAVLAVARETAVPLTMRGAGTSIAGNAVGPGIVVDTSRHLTRVLSLDTEARTAVVQPGTVHATLQREAVRHGLRFGPDPSTHTRCTIGGMVGNNACGSRALGYGRTADNVVALQALTASGDDVTSLADPLARLVDENLATIRPRFGRFSRQVSGYSLEHLLPEHGRSLDRFLVGSEGTLAVVTEATVRLVADPPHRVLAVLGYPSMAEAADAVPGLLGHAPVACEGLDHRIVDLVGSAPPLPRGQGWLLVEVTGDDRDRGVRPCRRRRQGQRSVGPPRRHRPRASRPRSGGSARTAPASPPGRPRLRPRRGGRTRPSRRTGSVPTSAPSTRCSSSTATTASPTATSATAACTSAIDFDLVSSAGRAGYRAFVEAAARLTADHGGSLSGEHGDGRARSELLPVMYDEPALALFAQVKGLFDPGNLLNPGVLVDPAPLDSHIRLAGVPEARERPSLLLRHDGGDLVPAVHRCTGVGKCLADNTGTGGVMCPSFQATRDEKDSTRGRARVLQDLVSGRLEGGWQSDAVQESLDLCLACKGCAHDCPTGVDMATYKAESLHRRYAGRRRPLTHYTLGRLPALVGLAPPALANLGLRSLPRWRRPPPASTAAARCPPWRAGRPAVDGSARGRARWTWCCGWTRSPTGSPRRWPRRRCGSSGPRPDAWAWWRSTTSAAG